MRKFKFSLESVLNLKTAEEKQAKAEVAAAMGKVTELENHKQELEDNLNRARKNFEEEAKNGLSPEDFKINYDYFDAQLKLIRNVGIEIGKAKELLRQKQEKLIAANLEKKTIEKLRETQYKEHMREENAKEAKELEDILTPKMLAGDDF